MLKQQSKLLNKIAIFLDLTAVLAAFFLAFHVRSQWVGLNHLYDYLWILLAILPTWYFLLLYYGFYASLRVRLLGFILASLLKVHVIGGIIITSIIYLAEPAGVSRGLIGFFLLFSYLFIGSGRVILKQVLSLIRRQGHNYRNILIVGTETKARDFVRLLQAHADWGLRVVGFLQLQNEPLLKVLLGFNVLGQLGALKEVCKFYAIDEVVFCLPKEYMGDINDHLCDLEEVGITVRMVIDFYDVPRSKMEFTFFHDEIPMLTFYSKAFDAGQLFLKRCLDIVGALAGLFATMLLFPFIALAIKIDSPGPLLFCQKRVGENGRIFKCWKFRSMYPDAEKRKKELLHLNEMSGAIFKIKDDPRITRVGKILRKTSLDELPQFWNVLKNEMSMVGTRPPTPEEVANYEDWHRKRICIKPGITGLWQVSGRNQIQDFDEVVRLDLEYIERWTFWLDIKILFRTLWVVFTRSGS